MTLTVISTNIADAFTGALCNTLLHSLWQGILLAVAAGLIVVCTKKAKPALRYNLLVLALLVFTVGVVLTFTLQMQSHTNNMPVGAAAAPGIDHAIATNDLRPMANVQPISFTGFIAGYLNGHQDAIVLIWFLIICARSIQLGFGLYGTYRLKRTNVYANAHWQQYLQRVARLLDIKQKIELLESGIARVPMVIGNLKPVILIPIGLLTALSAEDVEAILVHELAHIRRRDYLVNMLQCLLEIVFFFNPAVLWISQLIKAERENCCDDLALAQSNDKAAYIRALVSCEEYRLSVPAYAVAFAGNKGSLLQRVKRMATNRNQSLNLFEKTTLAVCLVLSGLCASAYAARENIKHTVHAVILAMNPAKVKVMLPQAVKTELKLKKHDAPAVLSAPKLNADPLPVVDSVAKPILVTLNKNVNANTRVTLGAMKVSLGTLNLKLDPLGKIDTNVKKVNVTVNDSLHTDVSVSTSTHTSTSYSPGSSASGKSKGNGKSASSSHSYSNYSYTYSPKYKYNYSGDTGRRYPAAPKPPIAPSAPYAVPDPAAPGVPIAAVVPVAARAPRPVAVPMVPTAPRPVAAPKAPDIADDLFKAHLISDKNADINVRLNNDELIINGVKQTEEAHQLILKKYVKKTGDSVEITYDRKGDHVSIHNHIVNN